MGDETSGKGSFECVAAWPAQEHASLAVVCEKTRAAEMRKQLALRKRGLMSGRANVLHSLFSPEVMCTEMFLA